MTDLDLMKLREVAEAATPGGDYAAAGSFMLTCTPATVLALLDRIEALEAEREHRAGFLNALAAEDCPFMDDACDCISHAARRVIRGEVAWR